MAFNPKKWWQSIPSETQRTILTCLLGIPTALFFTWQLVTGIVDRFSKEKPHYSVFSIPIAVAQSDKFIRQAMDKLKPYTGQTTVAIENNTSEKMTEVIMLFPREDGYWAMSDVKGNFGPLGHIDGRVELPPIPAMSSVVLTIWHKKPLDSDEEIVISSKEHKKYRASTEEEECVSPIYKWGFWVAGITVLVLVGGQVYNWQKNKAAPVQSNQ
jgi:hypothetical protein